MEKRVEEVRDGEPPNEPEHLHLNKFDLFEARHEDLRVAFYEQKSQAEGQFKQVEGMINEFNDLIRKKEHELKIDNAQVQRVTDRMSGLEKEVHTNHIQLVKLCNDYSNETSIELKNHLETLGSQQKRVTKCENKVKDLGNAARQLETVQKNLSLRMDKLYKELTEVQNTRAFHTTLDQLRDEYDAKVLEYRTIHDRLDN